MGKNRWLRNARDIVRKKKRKSIDMCDNLNLGEKINKIMDIEEEPFETLYLVEVAMNNDNNEFRNNLGKCNYR